MVTVDGGWVGWLVVVWPCFFFRANFSGKRLPGALPAIVQLKFAEVFLKRICFSPRLLLRIAAANDVTRRDIRK